MKKYVLVGIFGVGCIYAAASFFSHRNNGHAIKNSHITINVAELLSKENIVDIAVLGSGPAGLMASVYGCRAGRHVVCFEGNRPGGLLVKTTIVENWPGEKAILGPDIVTKMHEQAEALGTQFIQDAVIKTDFSTYPYRLETEEGLVIHALSVIIATGAEPKKLGVPGEEEFFGRGITTCAVCDARGCVGKDVIVVGGGDSAIEEAIQLTPYARSITIMVRSGSMRAAVSMQQKLTQYPTISVRYHASIIEYVGDETGFAGVVVRDNQSGAITKEPIYMVFLAIGHEPKVEMLDNQLTLCDTGHIALYGRKQHTSVPGVFAAGDVADHEYRQAGVAAGDGTKAALDADRFLVARGYSQNIAQQVDIARFYPSTKSGQSLIQSLGTVEELNAVMTPTSGLVLLDFYAEHCVVCMDMIPAFEWLAGRYSDALSVYAVDFDKAPDLAAFLGVTRVPTLLLFKNGVLIESIFTPLGKLELVDLIEQYKA